MSNYKSPTQLNDNKPYPISELYGVMKDWEHWQSQLAEKQRQITVERGKLESLAKEEAEIYKALASVEKKIRTITGNLEP